MLFKGVCYVLRTAIKSPSIQQSQMVHSLSISDPFPVICPLIRLPKKNLNVLNSSVASGTSNLKVIYSLK